jgi:hypothetical protein
MLGVSVDAYVADMPIPATLAEKGESFTASIGRLRGQLPYLASKPHVVGCMAWGRVFRWSFTLSIPQISIEQYAWFRHWGDGDEDTRRLKVCFDEYPSRVKQWFSENL